MKQVLLRKGSAIIENVPAPEVNPGSVLIKVVCSCISPGTELEGLNSSGESLVKKALRQPDKVLQAFQMFQREGFDRTISAIRQLTGGSPSGYTLSGIVLAVGDGVEKFRPGDRVAAAGAGYANHAEFVDVPENLVVRMPDSLDFPEASTVALGSIALHGVRRTELKVGESVVVFGLGVLGQLSVQMCRLAGYRVIAVDIDSCRLDLAGQLGAERCYNPEQCDVVKEITLYTGGYGSDAVLFCAATSDPRVLSSAFQMCRRKGKLVMVGVYGEKLNRNDIYRKEIDFCISSSYGPGRYDQNYEERGQDYPYAYVRWTQNRNMQEYLRWLSEKSISLEKIIGGIYSIDEAQKAYEALQQEVDRKLLTVLDYGNPDTEKKFIRKIQGATPLEAQDKAIRVGLIGPGSFAKGIHIPNLRKLEQKFHLHAIAGRTGSSIKQVAEQCGAQYSTSSYQEVLSDSNIDLVMICTRHDLHGTMVLEALEAGKHVFVEKPLCMNREELQSIQSFYDHQKDNAPILFVGYNRRFSPYISTVEKVIAQRTSPLFLHYRMNAGYIPPDHWVHGPEGGGRIIGEACHIIDLFRALVGSPVKSWSCAALNPSGEGVLNSDNRSIILEYENGSLATLDYCSIGSQKLSKEFLEVHFDEKTIFMDNYESLSGYGVEISPPQGTGVQKGHLEELLVLEERIRSGGEWPISLEELLETSIITLEAAKS